MIILPNSLSLLHPNVFLELWQYKNHHCHHHLLVIKDSCHHQQQQHGSIDSVSYVCIIDADSQVIHATYETLF
jgi:hypothetical protein